MSERNRNSIYHTWIALGLLLLAVLIWLVWGFASQQTESRIRGEQSTDAHIEYAEDRIDEECLTLDGMALRDCIHQEIEASRDHNRANQDLQAQQEMALFTKIMGATAVVGLVLGAGSVVLIFLTLSETQRMASDAREIGQAQVRAYMNLVVDGVEFRPVQNPDGSNLIIRFMCSIRNTGQSPASNVQVLFQIEESKPYTISKTRSDGSDMYGPKPSMTNFAAGEVRKQELKRTLTADLSALENDRLRYRLSYVIKYTDVFGETCYMPIVSATVVPTQDGDYMLASDEIHDTQNCDE